MPLTVTTPERPRVSAVVEGAVPLRDGTYFGFVRAIDPDRRTLDLDVAQWFSGDAAHRAEIQDGADASLDVYVRNQSELVRTLSVSAQVVVTAARCAQECIGQVLGTFEGLAQSFGPAGEPNPDYGDDYRGAHAQYWVTLTTGEVTRIDEQYRP